MSEEIKFNELHTCMGLNSCKNNGYNNSNACAGQGECSTVTHPCHVLNYCKGQGGCGLFGTTEELCHPSVNGCEYKGSCGAPILNSRFISQGPNKGLGVWPLARKRFEEQREAAGQPCGLPPGGAYGPTNEYVNTVRGTSGQSYSQCGQSGNRACSYAQNADQRKQEADARVLAMNKKTIADMGETLKTCSGDNC